MIDNQGPKYVKKEEEEEKKRPSDRHVLTDPHSNSGMSSESRHVPDDQQCLRDSGTPSLKAAISKQRQALSCRPPS